MIRTTLSTIVLLCHAFSIAYCDEVMKLSVKINERINSEITSSEMLEFIQANHTQTRIVGGKEVVVGRYPYMVALVDCNGRQFCGGSLIDSEWILTAAHCKGLATHVHIGRHDLGSREAFEEIEVDYERKHPLYIDSLSLNRDFLLIRLKSPSSYTPVKLDTGSLKLFRGTPVTAIGWGNLVPDSLVTELQRTSVLHEVEVEIIPNNVCRLSYGPLDITPNMICARGLFKDTCQGDSGGPLIIKGETAEDDIQVGITSFGRGCANPLFPGVYARVSKQYDWIERIIEETSIMSLRDYQYRFETWLNRIARRSHDLLS